MASESVITFYIVALVVWLLLVITLSFSIRVIKPYEVGLKPNGID